MHIRDYELQWYHTQPHVVREKSNMCRLTRSITRNTPNYAEDRQCAKLYARIYTLMA